MEWQQYAWLAVLTLVQIVHILVNRKNGKIRHNPYSPGESDTCSEHTTAIAKLEEAVDGIKQRLDRIERKLNGRIKL